MNLISILKRCSEDRLARIASAWDVQLPTKSRRENAQLLCGEIMDERALRSTLETLPQQEFQVLLAILKRPTFTARVDEIATGIGLDTDQTLDALRKLSASCLVYAVKAREDSEADEVIQPAESRTAAVSEDLGALLKRLLRERADPLSPADSLAVIISRWGLPDLERAARFWKVAARPGDRYREELMEAIADAMTTSTRVEAVIAGMDSGPGMVYSMLERAGDAVTVRNLREMVPGSEPVLRKRLRALSHRGLAIDTYLDGEWAVFVPQEIASARREEAARPSSLQEHFGDTTLERQEPYAILRDLLTLLDFLVWNDVELVKGGQFLPRWAMQQIRPLMTTVTDPDGPQMLDFICHSARELGLAEVKDGFITCSPAVDTWVALSFEEQAERLIQLWSADSDWHEPISPDEPFPWIEIDPTTIRRMLLGWLSGCRTDTTYSIESLRQIAQAEMPSFLVSRKGALLHKRYRSENDGSDDRPGFEARIAVAILRSALYWMGMVDLGRSIDGELVAFRVTPAGAALASGRPPDKVEPERALELGTDLQIKVLAPSSHMYWKLLKFTRPVAEEPQLRVIDEDSLHRGLEAGQGVQDILDVLRRQVTPGQLDDTRTRLESWARSFKRAYLERLVLLETDSPEVLDEIMKRPEIEGCSPRPISPSAVALSVPLTSEGRDESLRRIARELRRVGYSVSLR